VRIAQVRISRTVRGAETYALALSSALAERGHDIVFVTREGSPLVEMAEARGLRATGLEIAGDLNLRAPERIAEFVRAEEIDVVHAHGSHGVLGVCRGCRREGIPAVVTFHTPIFDVVRSERRPLWPALSRLRRPALWWASHVIAVSASSRRYLIRQGFDPARITAVLNGIEAERFRGADGAAGRRDLGIADDEVAFAFLARFIDEKRPEWVVRAAAQLPLDLPVRFIMAGEGPLADSVEGLVRELGVSHRVSLLGFREDTPMLLAAADCLVAPSKREGLPIAFLEAMAAGRPVIATDVGGVSELVVDGETGILVAPSDFGGFVGAIERLATDGDLRDQMGRASAQRIDEHFTMAVNAERVERVLREKGSGTFSCGKGS